MTVYGDLEISALRGLPGGRSAIATSVVPVAEKPAWLDRVWARLREEVAAGHQAYVVCPRVGGAAADEDAAGPPDEDKGPDEGEEERRPPLAVLDVAPQLAEGPLAGLRLGVLHGKLPPDEKDAVMRAFDAGEIVRSWPMRGTLHVVAAEDLAWMLPLGTPRPLAAAAKRREGLGLAEETLERAGEVAAEVLRGGGRRTRAARRRHRRLDRDRARARPLLEP